MWVCVGIPACSKGGARKSRYNLFQNKCLKDRLLSGVNCPGLIEAHRAGAPGRPGTAALSGVNCPGLIEARPRAAMQFATLATFPGLTAPASLKLRAIRNVLREAP